LRAVAASSTLTGVSRQAAVHGFRVWSRRLEEGNDSAPRQRESIEDVLPK